LYEENTSQVFDKSGTLVIITTGYYNLGHELRAATRHDPLARGQRVMALCPTGQGQRAFLTAGV